ncbi:proteasome maturation protein [Leptopilina heterotoma]|uniref:proteasome maturation protein n=1 Tax=Leptopilina heterotoma TaxID=63436 RepID=UPI001CA89268|nr:proteasome maturation protein [Leptopilina heterotoma]
MSFGYSSIKATPECNDKLGSGDNYGIQSPMVAGLGATRKTFGFNHPLEATEKVYNKNKERMEMTMLRNAQGLHAPMRLAMEIRSSEKIGRLPFLQSSMALRDSLLGRDIEIGFEDILNSSEFREQMGQPHAMVEKSLGIL